MPVTTATEESVPTNSATPAFLWLDLTRKCQLACKHCYNASGPDGTHGTMTREHWLDMLDQAADCGVRRVQFIGGEPTMHPDAADLVDHALSLGLEVEVFSNLVHVTDPWWELFQRDGVTLATSYYSNQAEEHDAMTRRRSHARTRANIARAIQLGIPLRVGIIGTDEQRIAAARQDLEAVGVTRIGADRVREFGRGARGLDPDVVNLCGRCGIGRAAIGPDGAVSPCIMSGWMTVGNVQEAGLADILKGASMAEAGDAIRSSTTRTERNCYPDQAPCAPDNAPPIPCGPDQTCTPGGQTDKCTPDD
jgi:MoaA/NifB/PqqE/SkfB family radical SAM enzyme